MKWEGNRESDNVEDARRSGGRLPGGVHLGGGRGIGLGTIAIALVAGWIFGINPLTVLSLLGGGGGEIGGMPTAQQAPAGRPPADDTMARFVSVVLADTEDVWHEQFRQMRSTYREPKLRLFRGAEPTACGMGRSAMGPFYCPGDQKVYIDLAFYETMRTQLGAPGDFAQAYVIAHEVGHHVQNLLGITGKVEAMRGRIGEAQGNAMSVRLELQADCFAGVWAHHAQKARQILEQGDLEEALHAASQIGDDALQRKSQGTVQPETFTHGSSAQRVRWFRTGLQTGSVQQCNTFEARQL
ncbi:neutral zinc metallopeptidase [uncultured Piscinibacter sp.]|uniref:KPN_02809 family neutral zinc metallopeptidase n=1 Tax=uncultured Piscinibacter sp. TaxID=1131835 RepID=UPI0026245F59|nr:neutral zinc metallopeptidase [uncultured Piscinibacter sp.]